MNEEAIISELTFKAVRSSGSGGQHVNKVSSKVELYFDIHRSRALSVSEKEILLKKLAKRMSSEGILKLSSEETRSQFRNKELVIKRFLELIQQALKPEKKRKATKPPKLADVKRLEEKQKRAKIKRSRKKPGLED